MIGGYAMALDLNKLNGVKFPDVKFIIPGKKTLEFKRLRIGKRGSKKIILFTIENKQYSRELIVLDNLLYFFFCKNKIIINNGFTYNI